MTVAIGCYNNPGSYGLVAIPPWEAWSGLSTPHVTDFIAGTTWAGLIASAQWIASCWRGKGYPLVLAVPMLVPDGSTLAQGASGAYDANFTKIAQTLVAAGHGTTTLRIGPEFNVASGIAFAGKDPASYMAFYRRIVVAMRAVPGASFKYCWNSSHGPQGILASTVYPGADVVDIHSQDVYDFAGLASETPMQRWTRFVVEPWGLWPAVQFANLHKKSFAYDEFGIGACPRGGGDNALFVMEFLYWMRYDCSPVYATLWNKNIPGWTGQLSPSGPSAALIFPTAAAAFLKYAK